MIENNTENDYLQELYNRLNELKEQDKVVSYLIQKPQQQGFLIKVGGLYGQVDFKHFPIRYKNAEIWKVIAPLLVGHKLYGKIKTLKNHPIQILVNGKFQLFENLVLEIDKPYTAIVVHKSEFQLTVELGYYFNWQYGSVLGYINKLSFKEASRFDVLQVGDEMVAYFLKQTFGNAPILGEMPNAVTLAITDVEKYIGTTQKVKVKCIENGKQQYSFGHKLHGLIPIQEIYYGNKNNRDVVRAFIKSLETGAVIDCEIVGIMHTKKMYLLKIIDTKLTQLL